MSKNIGYLIISCLFTIRLDKLFLFVYHRVMRLKLKVGNFTHRLGTKGKREDLKRFTARQFAKMGKKKLSFPIYLFKL